MGVKKISQKGKGSYAAYKASSTFLKNKKAKVARHLKAQPNDAKAVEALKAVVNAKIRKTPTRMKARLDSWVLANEKGEHTHNRSRNTLSGRLSPWGKFTQEAARFSKACANALANDPRKKLYLHNLPTQTLSDVWAGWAEFEANGYKPVNHDKKKPAPKHKKKPAKK